MIILGLFQLEVFYSSVTSIKWKGKEKTYFLGDNLSAYFSNTNHLITVSTESSD